MRLQVLLVSLAHVVAAGPVRAQATLNADVALSSAYVWRGVTSSSRSVAQPEATLGLPVGGGTLTIGVWTSVELGRYDRANDISAVYGLLPGPAFTQYSAWLEHAFTIGPADATAGVTTYTYPSVGGLAEQFNTVEVYGSIAHGGVVSPHLAAWYDLAAVRGAYVELGLSGDVTIRSTPVTVDAVFGASLGQGPDVGGRQAYFARDGVTHVDIAISTSLTRGPLSLSPTLHVIRAFDEMAQVTSPHASRGLKAWIGASLAWSSAP